MIRRAMLILCIMLLLLILGAGLFSWHKPKRVVFGSPASLPLTEVVMGRFQAHIARLALDPAAIQPTMVPQQADWRVVSYLAIWGPSAHIRMGGVKYAGAVGHYSDFRAFNPPQRIPITTPTRFTVVQLSTWPFIAGLGFYPALAGFLTVRHRFMARRFGGRKVCAGCGYDLTGNTSGVCPECGTAVNSPEYPSVGHDDIQTILRGRSSF